MVYDARRLSLAVIHITIHGGAQPLGPHPFQHSFPSRTAAVSHAIVEIADYKVKK